MKLFINNIIKFTFLTVLVYIIALGILGITKVNTKGLNFSSLNPGRVKLRIDDISHYDSLGILFLGSSHTFMGFDPRIFKKKNYDVFNFGSLAQTPIQTEYLYMRYAKKIKTDLIVFEINPQIISNKGIESNIDLLNSIEIDAPLSQMSVKTENLTVINTLVFRFIQDLFCYEIEYPGLGPYIKGTGYAPNKNKNIQPSIIHERKAFRIERKQIGALKRLIDFWEKSDIKFLLVQAPVTKKFYNSIENSSEIDSVFKSLGSYINYNKRLNLNDSLDFCDFHHLNQEGVNKFNPILLNDIK